MFVSEAHLATRRVIGVCATRLSTILLAGARRCPGALTLELQHCSTKRVCGTDEPKVPPSRQKSPSKESYRSYEVEQL